MTNDYRNIQLSDPRFERDGLRWLTFDSPALGRRGDVTLFVPPEAEHMSDLPLVILLHGVYGSHWAWALRGGAHHLAQQLIAAGTIRPMVLAMPSDGLWGDGSGYLRHDDADYEKWIVEDVCGCVRTVVPALSAQSPQFIAGLSMGGYGALRLGAKHTTRFRAISAHSAITKFAQLAMFVKEPLELYGTSSDAHSLAEERDVFFWLERQRDSLPPLRFDCGLSDQLLDASRELHARLTEAGIAHSYTEFPGGHEWSYWQEHLRDTLTFFAQYY